MSIPPEADEVARLRARVAELESQLRARVVPDVPLADLLWESLITENPDIIAVMDRQLRVVYINRVAAGYDINDVRGRNTLDFVLPEHRELAGEAFERVLSSGETAEYEVCDLANQWYHSRIAPLRRDGEVIAVVGVYSNVTERRRREDAAIQSETNLRFAMEQVPAIFWTTDRNLVFTSLQGAGLGPANLKPQRHIGSTLQELFAHSKQPAPAIPAHYRALEGGSGRYLQDYGGRVFQAYVEPLRDSSGATIGVIGIAQDITEFKEAEAGLRRAQADLERRVTERTAELAAMNERLKADLALRERVERELRESEDRFRTIAEAIAVPIAIADAQGNLLYVNLRTLQEFGWDAEGQLVGHLSREFFERPAEFDEVIARFRREGRICGYEVKVRFGTGSYGWISLWMDSLVYEGEPAIFGSFMNITARKEAEEELRRERNLLTHLVELHDRDRQIIAYEIHDGMVQDLTGAVMHLEGSVHALGTRAGEELAGLNYGIRLIRESINEARRLIGGLSPPILDEAGVVPAIENLIADIRGSGGPSVEFHVVGKLERLAPALEMAIYRIVQESLNNARAHSGSPKIEVRMTRSGNSLQLIIQDFGQGFDRKKTKKKRYGLTGIEERARLLGGEATIDSILGKGTTVRVRLPLVDLLQHRAIENGTVENGAVGHIHDHGDDE